MSEMIRISESIPERELAPDFTFLEIGVGSYPFLAEATVLYDEEWGRSNPNFYFDGERYYIGIDSGVLSNGYEGDLGGSEEIKKQAKRKLTEYEAWMRKERPNENVRFVFADIMDVPLPTGTINEVLISNVISSGISAESCRSMIIRARELLTPNGVLVIRETFTPHLSPIEDLTDELRSIGFQQNEMVTSGGDREAYDSLAAYYGPTTFDIDVGRKLEPQRYFCLAQA